MPYAVGSWKSRREKRKVLPRSVDYTGKKKATGTQDAAQSRVEETKQWIEEEERGQSSLRLHPLAGFFVVPRGGFADPFLGFFGGGSSSSSSSSDSGGRTRADRNHNRKHANTMGMPETWGIFWILLSGVCISGFAVSIIACVGTAREGAKALLSPRPANTPAANTTTTITTTTTSSHQEQQQQQRSTVNGDSGGNAGAVAGTATENRRESLLAGRGQSGQSNPPLASADATGTIPPLGAEGDVSGHGRVVAGEGGAPAAIWQQQGGSDGRRGVGAGSAGVQAGAGNVSSGGEVKTRSAEDRTAVQKIFKNFGNLSELLGLQKGAEDSMTSDELWHLAFAATKKRFEMLSCDLEANRVKLDRQLRDEKRRKPSKYGGAGGRATKGARGSRNGGGGGAAAAAAATAAAAAAAAARAAQSERVKALNMEGQVLEDLRQSLDEVLREWDTPLSDEAGGDLKSRSPPKHASSVSHSGRTMPPPPTPPSLETLAAAVGGSGDGATPVVNGSVASPAADDLSCGSNPSGGGGCEAGSPAPGVAGSANGHGSTRVQGAGLLGASRPISAGAAARCNASTRSNNNSSNKNSSGGKSGRLSSAAATAGHDSGRRRRRSSSSSESSNDNYSIRSRGAGDVTAGAPQADHRPTSSASKNRPVNNVGGRGHNDPPTLRPAHEGTRCFPPPLPRPAGARGIVEEARAFAPAQHLAVLQALLNGEEGEGDRGFQSDSSDSERDEGAKGGERRAGRVEGPGAGGVVRGEKARA